MNELPILLKDSWRFFHTNLWGLWKILFPIIVPLSLLNSLIFEFFPSEKNGWGLLFGVALLLYPIIQAATIFYISSAITGDPFSRRVCYKLSIKFWAPLFGLYIISSLAIFAGLILIIVPGLIVMARVMFSEFYCLLYKESSIRAFKSSWDQTKDYQWVLLVGVLIISIVTSVPVWLLESAVDWVGMLKLPLMFLIITIEHMLGCVITIFGYRVFTLHMEKLRKQSQQDPPDGTPLFEH